MAQRHPQTTKDAIASRRQQVAAFRLACLSQHEIATRLGVSVGTVNSDIAAVREEWAERRAQDYGAWVAEELAILDRLQRTLLPSAIQGDDRAVHRLLNVMDRRARMLGLDQPQRHEHQVITKDALVAEIERLEQEIGQRQLSEDSVGD